ncbi:Xaa-Pro dipeptidase [Clostridium tetani]|nr:Xaa-Pro dipeptidase [Clostridium tetani]RXM61397.1 Xaa-Pro dipeptidase [Clostridium tetani]RXM70222.1 Xaa-Pro dipeptidase [Clostridium tetani]
MNLSMYLKRLEKLREKMQENLIDGILLVGDSNRNYITGFTGEESFALITKKEAIFITDSRYVSQAKTEVENFEIMEYKIDIHEFVANLAEKLCVKMLGFEEDIITYGEYEKYRKKFKGELKPLNGIVEELRSIKDEFEIKCIKEAASIADKAFENILKIIKPKITEKDIALELEYFMKKMGASDLSFDTIVASGKRSSLPHGRASSKVIEEGEFVTLDFGCIYNGYCSDMTRTIAVGSISEEMKKVYDIVLTAQKMAIEKIKPGVVASHIDKYARNYIIEMGYGRYFGHGLGHGVGRDIHEEPRLSPKGNKTLKPGMVVTDEPGIYIENSFGVRIEDLILVTENSCEIISKSPKDLIII